MLKFTFSSSTSFKRSFLIFSLVLIAASGFSQQKKPYTLLWKISGNGLAKPSFLFGTMHVKDSKAFNFSDSVLTSIKSCSAFALELHPDTMMHALLDSIFENNKKQNAVITDKQYDELAARFLKKNGYPLDRKKAENPFLIESLMTPRSAKKDDKSTFVDAWLYGIAKTMQKNIYGLEQTADQLKYLYGNTPDEKSKKVSEIFDRNKKYEKGYMASLIDVYSRGNLNEIQNFLGNENFEDSSIVERNKVMVNSIIKLLYRESVFAAVGTAHLPGEKGVIQLLKNEGYQVNPVTANFTGEAQKYSIDQTKMKWYTYVDNEHNFSMDVPTEPITSNVVMGLPTVLSLDLTNEVVYGSYAIFTGPVTKSEDELINKILDNYKKKGGYKLISNTKKAYPGFKSNDLSIKLGTSYMRMQIIFQNNTLYCLYVGNKLEDLHKPYAERFFNSLKITKPVAVAATEWIDFKNTEGAFLVKLPSKPQPITKDIPNPQDPGGAEYTINMYVSTDQTNLMNYLVRYNDFPLGSYLENQDKVFEETIKTLTATNKALSEPVKITKDGYEGREIKILIKDLYPTDIQIFVRGNRTYLLMRPNMNEKGTAVKADEFLKSFKFQPFHEPEFYTYSPDDKSFKMSFTSAPKITRDSINDTKHFVKNTITCVMKNPFSGSTHLLEYSDISKYYRAESLDSLYNFFVKSLVKYPDSLIKEDKIVANGVSVRDYVTVKRGTDEQRRYRFWITNGRMYHLSGYVSKEELFDKVNNNLYNSFALATKVDDNNLFTSKAKVILTDLRNPDTTVSKDALGALSFYRFNKTELPLVYDALQKTYPDDNSANGARAKLVSIFQSVNDENSVTKLTSLFNTVKNADAVKASILTTLPEINKQEGFSTYFKLLTESAPVISEKSWGIFSPLRDSLAFTYANFNKILPLINHTTYRENVLALASNLVYDKQPDYKKLIETNSKILSKYALSDLDSYIASLKDKDSQYTSGIYYYLNLMEEVNYGNLTDVFTGKLLKGATDEWMRSRAVTTRISNDLSSDAKLVAKLLDSIGTRFEVIKAYDKVNQLAKVPAKYTRPDEFARLCLYNYLVEEDENAPDNIALLGTVPVQDSVYFAFALHFKSEDADDEIYTGIIGPYKTASPKLDFENYKVNINWDSKSENWKEQAKVLIEGLNKREEE